MVQLGRAAEPAPELGTTKTFFRLDRQHRKCNTIQHTCQTELQACLIRMRLHLGSSRSGLHTTTSAKKATASMVIVETDVSSHFQARRDRGQEFRPKPSEQRRRAIDRTLSRGAWFGFSLLEFIETRPFPFGIRAGNAGFLVPATFVSLLSSWFVSSRVRCGMSELSTCSNFVARRRKIKRSQTPWQIRWPS